MGIRSVLVVATIGLAVLAVEVRAQAPSGVTPQQLDQMSKERMQAIGPRNWGPPVPPRQVPREIIRPASRLLVCMSAAPWKPVFAAPSSSSRAIGKTSPTVAVSGRTVDGFVPILFGPGKTGYVPALEVRPFQSTVKPGLSCTISGIRPDGSAVFDIR